LRRTPSLLDIGQVPLIMWDGRKDNLYNQVFGPTESAIESNSSRLYLAEQVFARYRAEYEAVFGLMVPSDDPGRFSDTARFPPLTAEATGCRDADDFAINEVTCPGPMHGAPGDGAEYDGMTAADQEAATGVVVNVGKALAAYQRLLSCGPSRFDAWVHGDEAALSEAEQRGAALFVGKANCVACHSGPYFSDQQFHNVGLEPISIQASGFIDADDRGAAVGLATAIADPLNTKGVWSDAEGGDGRLPSEVPEGMEGAFRTPMLRCGAARPAFMHTGQFKTLREVVAFFSRGGSPSGYPGHNELEPLNLTREEQDDLVAFLRALDGPGPDERLLSSP
jgi:cytochrome c peroxidase